MKKFIYFLLTILMVSGCTDVGEIVPNTPTQANITSNYSADFLHDWFKLECRLVKDTPGFFPPQAARVFAYTGIAAYESVYRGIPEARSLAGQINAFNPSTMPRADAVSIQYHWGIVANAAVADIMRLMFDKNLSKDNLTIINQKEEENFKALRPDAASKAVADLSVELGKAIAEAVFEYSKTDGGHESYLNPFSKPFTPVKGIDKWIPTDAKNQTPLSPGWKSCRPLLTANMEFALPPKPIDFSVNPNSNFYKAALQVYDVVKRAKPEEQEIARFWADDPFSTCTPTGHTFNIMSQLLEETEATLEKSAVGYAMLAIAENDAFITCWKVKYDYNLIRPVSYIQKYIDVNFKTVIGTPPFPAYTSGHATEAAVGERVFTKLFTNGDGKYSFTDRSQLQHGFGTRKFDSFMQVSEECGDSRLYGGIHYDMDNQLGLQMGRGIGNNVIKLINWPKNVK
jgi:hypothetical protein